MNLDMMYNAQRGIQIQAKKLKAAKYSLHLYDPNKSIFNVFIRSSYGSIPHEKFMTLLFCGHNNSQDEINVAQIHKLRIEVR